MNMGNIVSRLISNSRCCCVLLLLAAIFSVSITSLLAASPGNVDREFGSDEEELAAYEGLFIDSIIIDNREIYDTKLEAYDKFIYRTVNSVRFKTRRSVVAREVLLQKGRPFSARLAEETARNLRLRLTVYDAWIEVTPADSGHIIVRVVTIDQWSFAAGLDVQRDGNRERYNVGVTERNFLGWNQLIDLDYTVQSHEDNLFLASFSEPRTLGRKIRTDFAYSDTPAKRGEGIAISRPFYDRFQRISLLAQYESNRGQRDVYDDSIKVATSEFVGDNFTVDGSYRFGNYHRKWSVGATYRYEFEKTGERRLLAQPSHTIEFPNDSLSHQIVAGLGWSNLDFVKTRRVDGFGYTEDFTLGIGASITYGRAFGQDFGSYLYDRCAVGLGHAARLGHSIVMSSYRRGFWFRGGNEIRTTDELESRVYNRVTTFLTIAARVRYLTDHRPRATNNLILGGDSGVRGLNVEAQTGDRLLNLNLESRWFSGIEILTVSVGGVLFSDAGVAWRAGESVTFDDMLVSAGAGLRFALAGASRARQIRIDLAYSDQSGWQFSIGTGQYFQASHFSFP